MIGENCRLLFVGINPGLQTAMTGIHFAHPSNRFWPALRKAGLIDWSPNVSPVAPSVRIGAGDELVTVAKQTDFTHPSGHSYPALGSSGLIDLRPDLSMGMTETQRADFVARSMGITNLVNRATARASELRRDELRLGARRLTNLIGRLAPAVVAVAGITAYRDAFEDRKALPGLQPKTLANAELWVVANPSGLNAHETIDSLAASYLEVGRAAGIA